MALTHEPAGPKIIEKIKIFILSRAKLLCSLCHEIPCNWNQMSFDPCCKNTSPMTPKQVFFCLKEKTKKIRGILCNYTGMQCLLHSSSKDEQKHLFFHFKSAKTSWQIAQEKTVYFQGANIHRFYLHPHIWFFRCYSEFLGMELVKKKTISSMLMFFRFAN